MTEEGYVAGQFDDLSKPSFASLSSCAPPREVEVPRLTHPSDDPSTLTKDWTVVTPSTTTAHCGARNGEVEMDNPQHHPVTLTSSSTSTMVLQPSNPDCETGNTNGEEECNRGDGVAANLDHNVADPLLDDGLYIPLLHQSSSSRTSRCQRTVPGPLFLACCGFLVILLVGLSTQVVDSPHDSKGKNDHSAAPSASPRMSRSAAVLACAKVLSDGRGFGPAPDLLDDVSLTTIPSTFHNTTPQLGAVSWLINGPGRLVDVPYPCRWNSLFGQLYSLIVTRGALQVTTASWHDTTGTPYSTFAPICLWKRITCNPQLDSIEKLSLNHAGLIGSIPIEMIHGFASTNSLTGLFLDNNQLQGPLPTELGQLSQLEDLLLHQNVLTGTIPSSLGNLVSLKQCLLDRNRLTGTVPASVCNVSHFRADCKTLVDCSTCSKQEEEGVNQPEHVNNEEQVADSSAVVLKMPPWV